MFTSQSHNYAGGDVIAGDKIVTHVHNKPSPLALLYEKLRDANASNPEAAKISEQLQHYCNSSTDGDIRGLQEKLIQADRKDLIFLASRLKEAAAKTIMKWQTSGIAQDILTHILSNIYTEFLLHVTPAIQAGASRIEVDALISERVIKPTTEILGENHLGLTTTDILALLFFLGGNCHIRWDSC